MSETALYTIQINIKDKIGNTQGKTLKVIKIYASGKLTIERLEWDGKELTSLPIESTG